MLTKKRNNKNSSSSSLFFCLLRRRRTWSEEVGEDPAVVEAVESKEANENHGEDETASKAETNGHNERIVH
jgi:hypothetical protein